MLFSLLRDCVRVGVTAIGGVCGALSVGKDAAQHRVRSYIKNMGFVSREEFETLRECIRHSQTNTQDKSLKSDKK